MKKISVIAFIASIFLATAANADPVGQWTVDQYDFVTKAKINTVTVCFMRDGTLWHTGNTRDYQGTWKSVGDVTLMRMNNILNPAYVAENTLTAFSPTQMTGYGQGWTTSNTIAGAYTVSVWKMTAASC